MESILIVMNNGIIPTTFSDGVVSNEKFLTNDLYTVIGKIKDNKFTPTAEFVNYTVDTKVYPFNLPVVGINTIGDIKTKFGI